MRVLGISGSLRRDSHNTKLLRAAGEIVDQHGGEFEVFGGLKAIPPYCEDDEIGDGPAAVADLKRAISNADAVLFATPEYNSSIPGVLKNAIDWVSRPLATSRLRNKPVAVIGASTGSSERSGPRRSCARCWAPPARGSPRSSSPSVMPTSTSTATATPPTRLRTGHCTTRS
jgi:NAD(P)H-dependent FMN reductase